MSICFKCGEKNELETIYTPKTKKVKGYKYVCPHCGDTVKTSYWSGSGSSNHGGRDWGFIMEQRG
jgi:DNA-directed RNA polymerase subunit RPC12/RpoP